MSTARLTRAGALLAASLLLSSCAGVGSRSEPANCPVTPVPTVELSGVELRARVHFTIGSEEAHLEAIARSTPEELRIVGIAAYGTRLFAVHQRGREIRVEGASSRKSEFLALWTLDALHRSIWIHTPTTAGSGPVVSWNRENERVTESIEAGERHREFTRPRASAPVRVRTANSDAAASRFEVQNPWCGYEAVIAVVDSAAGPSGE